MKNSEYTGRMNPVIRIPSVLPAKEGFYVLRFKAPPDTVKSHEGIFQSVLDSLEPLIK